MRHRSHRKFRLKPVKTRTFAAFDLFMCRSGIFSSQRHHADPWKSAISGFAGRHYVPAWTCEGPPRPRRQCRVWSSRTRSDQITVGTCIRGVIALGAMGPRCCRRFPRQLRSEDSSAISSEEPRPSRQTHFPDSRDASFLAQRH